MPLFCNTFSNDKNMTKVSHSVLASGCVVTQWPVQLQLYKKRANAQMHSLPRIYFMFHYSTAYPWQYTCKAKSREIENGLFSSAYVFTKPQVDKYSHKLLTLILWLWKRGLWSYGAVNLKICTLSLLYCPIIVLD